MGLLLAIRPGKRAAWWGSRRQPRPDRRSLGQKEQRDSCSAPDQAATPKLWQKPKRIEKHIMPWWEVTALMKNINECTKCSYWSPLTLQYKVLFFSINTLRAKALVQSRSTGSRRGPWLATRQFVTPTRSKFHEYQIITTTNTIFCFMQLPQHQTCQHPTVWHPSGNSHRMRFESVRVPAVNF